MKVICSNEICTGCGACVSACPSGCVTLREDAFGELHPLVDENHCISCGRCTNACPNNKPPRFHYPSACYAAWLTDRAKRLKCASGGVGTAIAEYVVGQKGGVVFGTAYDANLVPVTICAKTLEAIERLKGSKYVQSVVPSDLLRQIRAKLDEGYFVAYIATPCQIAAARVALGDGGGRLLLVDLICHGVSPTRLFTETIDVLKSNPRYRTLKNVTFRGNDGGNYSFSLWGDKLLSRTGWKLSPYFAGFLQGVSLRESCYACHYARPERISDLTIGDFIGLGSAAPFDYGEGNVSSVTTNTLAGERFWRELRAATPALFSTERTYAERLGYRPSLLEPFPRHELNAVYRALVPKLGLSQALNRTLGGFVRAHRRKKFVLDLLKMPRRLIGRIYRILSCRRPRSVVVVTWRAGENYGTSLQAFALEWKIRQLGYRTRILSSVRTTFTRKVRIASALRIMWLLSPLLWLRRRLHQLRATPVTLRRKKLQHWARHVHRSADVTYPRELKRLLRTTDCFVTGSDQIWNSYYSFNPTMYLAFAGGKRRVAYASSVGTRQVNPVYEERVRLLLSRFAAIGVREYHAVKMLNRLLGRDDVRQVVDPTLLVSGLEWRQIVARTELSVDGEYVMVYLIGARENYAKQVREVVNRCGIANVVLVPSVENPDFRVAGCTVADAVDPFGFVKLIAGAKLVCTDSFHATALSLNLGVPFVEFVRFDDNDERSQNTRIYDLLSHYGLEGRLYDRGIWNSPVDYAAAWVKLDEDRRSSLAYLTEAIGPVRKA